VRGIAAGGLPTDPKILSDVGASVDVHGLRAPWFRTSTELLRESDGVLPLRGMNGFTPR
jgi:hypothetical protein